MDPRLLLPLLTDVLPAGALALTADPAVADAASQAGLVPTPTSHEPVDVVLLLSDEVAIAAERGPSVLDAAVRACRPGGWVVIAVPSAVHGQVTGAGDGPGVSASDLRHMLMERGLDLRLMAAPGAAAALAGRPWAGIADLDLDRSPGLLDAGPVVLAVGRTPRSASERSRTFYASITRKIVAAAVLCRDAQGRVLLVFDTFKGAWTFPGGLVDAGESPLEGAVREAREEGGVDVEAGELLGVFAHDMPERVHLVYAARPLADVSDPTPLHDHEISEVRWMDLDQAHEVLDAHMQRKLDACLHQPGRTWRW